MVKNDQSGPVRCAARPKRASGKEPRPVSISRRILLPFLFLFPAAGFAGVQSPAPQPASPPTGVTIEIRPSPDTATVGDPIRMDIVVRFPAGGAIRLPQLTEKHGDFTILEVQPGPEIPDESGSQKKAPAAPAQVAAARHRARIIAAAYKPGEANFPSLQLAYRDAAGREITIQTPAVSVKIQSVLTSNDDRLKDLKKQAEIEEPFNWLRWLGILALACGAALLAWWIWKRRRPAPIANLRQPARDPLQAAEKELRELLGRGLLESGMVKPFYVVFSEIVKRMMEAGYDIPTAEKTTSEIMDLVRNTPDRLPSDEEMKLMERLLVGSDLVKFAKSTPAAGESESHIQDAFRLLAECRRRRQAAEPAAATSTGAA